MHIPPLYSLQVFLPSLVSRPSLQHKHVEWHCSSETKMRPRKERRIFNLESIVMQYQLLIINSKAPSLSTHR